jgi:hypothetical protein
VTLRSATQHRSDQTLVEKKSMPTLSDSAATPNYLLLEANVPIGPTVRSALADDTSLVVYGFSGKPAYDQFIASSNRDLRPYPLTKGYLQRHSAEDSRQLRLVVVDASNFQQPTITAVSMASALKAQSDSSAQIETPCRLHLQSPSGVYHLADSCG